MTPLFNGFLLLFFRPVHSLKGLIRNDLIGLVGAGIGLTIYYQNGVGDSSSNLE